jgi:hypothetical protein
MKLFVVAIALMILPYFAASAHAQRRDYMTEAEIELVRDSQEIDKRIDVLTKMIDRRFTALGIEVGGLKPGAKEQKALGELRPVPDHNLSPTSDSFCRKRLTTSTTSPSTTKTPTPQTRPKDLSFLSQ